jgi:tetratricopeptide (TPR) repeat protein
LIYDEFYTYQILKHSPAFLICLSLVINGFSLRSKRLLQALSNKDIVIDSLKYGEDTFICRTYRRFLEKQYNIKFAPESIADRFSHERFEPIEPIGKPFGFHGLFNIWRYIKPDELRDFINLISPRSITAKQAIEAIELGLNYHTSGHLRQAEIIYQKILEHYPDHTDVLALLKGLTHHKSGHLREAEMVYREMLEDYPDHIYLLALLEMVRS